MAAQQPAAFAFADSLVGYELDVLVDSDEGGGVYTGRTFADAPEIDASVRLTGEDIEVGEFVPAELTARNGYDWLAEAACDDD